MDSTFIDLNSELQNVHKVIYLTTGGMIILDKKDRPVRLLSSLLAEGPNSKLQQYFWAEAVAAATLFAIGSASFESAWLHPLTRVEFEAITNSRFIIADGPLDC